MHLCQYLTVHQQAVVGHYDLIASVFFYQHISTGKMQANVADGCIRNVHIILNSHNLSLFSESSCVQIVVAVCIVHVYKFSPFQVLCVISILLKIVLDLYS